LDTLDAIIILFIPKAVLATSAAVMNTRILGGPIGPIISGVIPQTFLIQVTTDGKEELFPSAVAFNLIFFICLILAIVLTIKVVSIRNRAIKVTSSSAASGINRQTTSFQLSTDC
jgi:hypothetical protein